jgi:large subunit ribosomal protein L10
MAKLIKQMQMDDLRKTFQEVRDMVLLTASGVTCQADNQMRLALRKKNIRLQVVKNSLARRVFDEMGMKADGFWAGTTIVAWGSGSLSELSRELDTYLKKNDKIKAKGALSEGQAIGFVQALKMPTRAEAVARVVGLALSPAGRLLSQLTGPAGRVASQIKELRERVEGAAPAEAAPAATE